MLIFLRYIALALFILGNAESAEHTEYKCDFKREEISENNSIRYYVEHPGRSNIGLRKTLVNVLIDDNCINQITRDLRENANVTSISISGFRIYKEHMLKLIEALENNKGLRNLTLSSIDLTAPYRYIESIMKSLESNMAFESLTLDCNYDYMKEKNVIG